MEQRSLQCRIISFVGIGQAEQIEHDLGRKPGGEIEISVERVAAFERIEDDVDAALHHRPQALDRARRHRLEEQRLQAVVIGVVAVKQPAIVMLDNVAETLWIGARQIRIERLDPIDAEVGPVLQFEDVVDSA